MTVTGKELPFAVKDSALVSTDRNGLFLIGGCTNCNPRYGHRYSEAMLFLKNSTSEWKEIELPSSDSFKRKKHIALTVNDNEKMLFCGKFR